MRRVLGCALLLILSGCSVGTSPLPDRAAGAPAERAAFVPGADGGGDPYFPRAGNGGYDVTGYDLTVRYSPGDGRLSGIARLKATALDNLSRFNLDLTGLSVRSVSVNGVPATGSAEGGELVVTPTGVLVKGQEFTAVVRYAGRPVAGQGRLGWHRTVSGGYAPAGPESARTWFPVNGSPSDKATFSVRVTVPKGLAAVSNGVPAGRTTSGATTTWDWATTKPMPGHLAFLAIGDYRVRTATHRGKAFVTAFPASLPSRSAAARGLARSAEIADWLERFFGPYPSDAYGGALAVAPEQAGSAAREVARHWFGGSVTMRTWQDFWLSEGFATYAQWLWNEHTGGPSVEDAARERYETYPWQVLRARDPGVQGLFSSGPANRGALTLHALRRRIGDDRFFGLLRTWVAEHAYGTATTADFVAAAERASGQKLGAFFDVWLSGAYRPTY